MFFSYVLQLHCMMTSSNGNIFHVTGHSCREFTGLRWIPHTKASDAELMFSMISAQINGWGNNREAGEMRRIRPHYDVTVIVFSSLNIFHVQKTSSPRIIDVMHSDIIPSDPAPYTHICSLFYEMLNKTNTNLCECSFVPVFPCCCSITMTS